MAGREDRRDSRIQGSEEEVERMPESETIEFVQIATAKEHLYGMTRQGAVWKYDPDRELWEPLSMAFSVAPKRRGFEHGQRH
jgi:hypothetical protein